MACVIVVPDVFLSLCLALMVASLLETILITNLCHSAASSPVPRWVRLVVLQTLGRLVRLQPKLRDLEDTVIQNRAAEGRISIQNLLMHLLQQNDLYIG